MRPEPLGPSFRWLWAAFSVSTLGTWLAFDAFTLVAVLALDAGPTRVSLLAAVGLTAAAVAAVPLGPWVERRRKRRVMVGADLVRFVALLSVPVAYAWGALRFGQLLLVVAVVGAADICFRAASGACLRGMLRPDQLLTANARFESTTWTATMLGPPLGGALVGVLGPVTTIAADAGSYLLSALGLRVIAGGEASPAPTGVRRRGELWEGWRVIREHPRLRSLFLNTVAVNALVMATAPLVAVLMLRDLGIAPWQYGLAFAAPCLGGLAGARLARTLVPRLGQPAVLRRAGTLRACWSVGLALVPAGWAGVAVVAVVQLGLVTCMGVFNPVFATYRLEQTPADLVVRTLTAWTVSSKLATAAATAAWGGLAAVVGLRTAIAAAGLLLLATPLLLPRTPGDDRRPAQVPELVPR